MCVQVCIDVSVCGCCILVDLNVYTVNLTVILNIMRLHLKSERKKNIFSPSVSMVD